MSHNLSNPHPSLKQIQPNQILDTLQPVALLTISTFPKEDEPEPEEREPEPEQQTELLPNRVLCDLYNVDGTPDYKKASAYMGDVIARLKKTIK